MPFDTVAQRWNKEYRRGRYSGDGPTRFVCDIMEALSRFKLDGGRGLYVGCGVGRNYIPLVNSGLDIFGIDPSDAAIEILSRKIPKHSENLSCCRLEDLGEETKYDYIVSIQVFQHGRESEVLRHFKKAGSILNDGGLLFLRVNSASTEVYYRHKTIERNRHGGFTVNYAEGPKHGLDVHFFSKGELKTLLSRGFRIVSGPTEDTVARSLPKTGSWSQWEVIAQKARPDNKSRLRPCDL